MTNSLSSQTLGGFTIIDYLRTATHPNGCDVLPLVGPPDDSMWVNLMNYQTMTGTFGANITGAPGNLLLLETSFNVNTYSYEIKLKYNNSQYTPLVIIPYGISSWTYSAHNVNSWNFSSCNYDHNSSIQTLVSTLSIPGNFSLTPLDTIKGIQVTFKGSDPDIAGVYLSKGCSSINMGSDISLCMPNETAILGTPVQGATYLWSNGSTSPFCSIDSGGKFWVQVKRACGVVTDTIHVEEPKFYSLNLGSDTILCNADTISINLTNFNCAYQWQDLSVNPVYKIFSEGTYWVKLTNKYCFYSDTVFVRKPNLDLGSDTTYCNDHNYIILASVTGASYLWNDGTAQ